MLQVTPNGPWGKAWHHAIPVTVDEVVTDVAASFAAGADGVHLHVRDKDGAETLEPRLVNEMCARVREAAGGISTVPEIGLTTGAWIVPDLAERLAMLREWEGVDCATVNVCEPGFERVMETLADRGIGIDAGVRIVDEVAVLEQSGLLGRVQRVSVELDPGQPYFLSGSPTMHAQLAHDALDSAGATCPRLTHGAGAWTWPLVEDAFRRGHDTRVGFEDSHLLPDGTAARSNADLVREAVRIEAAIRGERTRPS